VERGTLFGLAIAAVAAALLVAGLMLGRRRPGSGAVALPSLAVALAAVVLGTVGVGVATQAYESATVPTCPDAEASWPSSCAQPGDARRSAGAMGLLGGLIVGVVAGCAMAWRRSRSLKVVAGGLLAAAGGAVLTVEGMVVMLLWAG